MAYSINLTDATLFATVADGTQNTSSSMTIIGKNFSGYGEQLGENFIRLLESNANTSAPSAPLIGQLWYDKTTNLIKAYNGTIFKSLSGAEASLTAPTSPIEGDLWFKNDDDQLYIYNGAAFILVGPQTIAGLGLTGAVVEVITSGATTINHTVTKLYIENTVVGIWNEDAEFTPDVAITGFATVKPGLQMSTTVTGALFQGTATDSQLLDGIDSTGFLSALSDDTTAGTLGVLNDGGLAVGVDSDFTVTVSGTDVTLANATVGGDMTITVDGVDVLKFNDSGVGSNEMTGHFLPATHDTYDLGSADVRWKDLYMTGTSIYMGASGATDGKISWDNATSTFAFEDASGGTANVSSNVSAGNVQLGVTTANTIDTTSGGLVLDSADGTVIINGNVSAGNVQLGVTTANTIDTTSGGLVLDGADGTVIINGNLTVSGTTTTVDSTTLNVVDLNITVANGAASAAAANGAGLTVDGPAGATITYTNTNNSWNFNKDLQMGANNIVTSGEFQGKATSAEYADLAERFEADEIYVPGTVVELGGDKEVTQCNTDASENVFGVVSTDPAYLMNSGIGNDNTHPPIALAGRVPVNVIGVINKGDRLVTAGNGLARAAKTGEATLFNVIGRALENKTTIGSGNIELIVKIN
jgi:hypothetical protein